MKKLLIASIVILSLVSYTSTKYGCEYKKGKEPKFRADIQVQGVLEKVLQNNPGKAILQMKLKDTTAYVYYGYCNKVRFVIGSKWTLQFDSRDTCKIKRSIVKLNS